ncbi:MAG: hypothetical protein IJG56_03970, partial [Clostridia bacterium]|nr:hypothetical protein [Clostridia bacterium]
LIFCSRPPIGDDPLRSNLTNFFCNAFQEFVTEFRQSFNKDFTAYSKSIQHSLTPLCYYNATQENRTKQKTGGVFR